MSGKLRHGKGKHPVRSKRRRSGRDSLAIAAQQTPVSQTYKAVLQPKVSAPSPSTPTPTATVTTARYPYIITELRRIGILAGITLVILVVLALVLS
jgi:hypothetical protein